MTKSILYLRQLFDHLPLLNKHCNLDGIYSKSHFILWKKIIIGIFLLKLIFENV